MATMPRNMVTLGTKSLPNDLHSESKWSKSDDKNRIKTDYKAKVQNITKHNYLLCSVKVSHLRKDMFWHPWTSSSNTSYQLKVRPSKTILKISILNKHGAIMEWSLFNHLWPFMASRYQKVKQLASKPPKYTPTVPAIKPILSIPAMSTNAMKLHHLINKKKCKPSHNYTIKPRHLAGQV